MDTKLKKLIERCKLSSPTGYCEGCGCNERQCLDALLDEFTNRRLENKEIKEECPCMKEPSYNCGMKCSRCGREL